MTIRTILVPVRGDGKGAHLLDHAYALAQPFNAHIAVVHCRPRPEDLIPFGVAVPRAWRDQITASASGIADTEEAQVSSISKTTSQAAAWNRSTPGPRRNDKVTISWSEETGKQAAIVATRGRLASVVAVARPDREANLGFNTLEAALLETGRPVLLCPPAPDRRSAGVAIAWNGSTEVSRAIAVSMPVIAEAETCQHPVRGRRVMTRRRAAADLQALSAEYGIDAAPIAISSGGRIGQRLLDAAGSAGADLLVMGAYGRSRGREMILGGATQSIVEDAEMPVLLPTNKNELKTT